MDDTQQTNNQHFETNYSFHSDGIKTPEEYIHTDPAKEYLFKSEETERREYKRKFAQLMQTAGIQKPNRPHIKQESSDTFPSPQKKIDSEKNTENSNFHFSHNHESSQKPTHNTFNKPVTITSLKHPMQEKPEIIHPKPKLHEFEKISNSSIETRSPLTNSAEDLTDTHINGQMTWEKHSFSHDKDNNLKLGHLNLNPTNFNTSSRPYNAESEEKFEDDGDKPVKKPPTAPKPKHKWKDKQMVELKMKKSQKFPKDTEILMLSRLPGEKLGMSVTIESNGGDKDSVRKVIVENISPGIKFSFATSFPGKNLKIYK